MTYYEYILLYYITFGYKISVSQITEKELAPYLDYYERVSVSQEEIDLAISSLIEKNCIYLEKDCYKPSETIKQIKKKSRCLWGDWFGCRKNTAARFRKNIETIFGGI